MLTAALAHVETAILQTVAYSDIFDYPLTAGEVHHYLVGVEASPSAVEAALGNGRLVGERLGQQGGYFFLAGRQGIVETRLRRGAVAASQWPKAWRYGSLLARLPFVRMVAVTGALAMNNAEPATDTDYLIVTKPGRLWISRAMAVGLVRWAARRGDVICPNYFLSERALVMERRNLFTAHELAQMVPVSGLRTYSRLCELNGWAVRFLPNAFPVGRGRPRPPSLPNPEEVDRPPLGWRCTRLVAEAALESPVGSWLERWEMHRKVQKLTRELEGCGGRPPALGAGREAEVAFSLDRCKGHFDQHGQRTLESFDGVLRARAILFPTVVESAASEGEPAA